MDWGGGDVEVVLRDYAAARRPCGRDWQARRRAQVLAAPDFRCFVAFAMP